MNDDTTQCMEDSMIQCQEVLSIIDHIKLLFDILTCEKKPQHVNDRISGLMIQKQGDNYVLRDEDGDVI